MITHKDQLGNTIRLFGIPKRIISLVPSQSEFLWDIGVRNELIGITKFCIHPNEMYAKIEKIGGTKKLNINKIRSLKPDLIIGNKEENSKEEIQLLQKEFNVWMSDIYTFDDSFNMMLTLGKILNCEEKAQEIVSELNNVLPKIKNSFSNNTVAYFIWNKPYLFAAKNTFIDYVLNYLGLENVLNEMGRYPEVSIDNLKALEPEFCFLSSEPFPFKEKHIKLLQTDLPNSKIVIVDGELFSWYGSRLLHLNNYIIDLKQQLYA